jgi:hypothetical protein
MGEHVIRLEPQEILAIALELLLGGLFLGTCDLVRGGAVVDDVDLGRRELRGQMRTIG